MCYFPTLTMFHQTSSALLELNTKVAQVSCAVFYDSWIKSGLKIGDYKNSLQNRRNGIASSDI